MRLYPLLFVAFVIAVLLIALGGVLRNQVCIAAQTMTAEERVVLPVECSP